MDLNAEIGELPPEEKKTRKALYTTHIASILANIYSGKLTPEQAATRLANLTFALEARAYKTGERKGMRDELTGLLNRKAFNADLRELQNSNEPFGLLLADIDHFKKVNDTFGHSTGDAVLVGVGLSIISSTRQDREVPDGVYRIGGEEIAVLLPGVAGEEDLRRIAENICQTARTSPVTYKGGESINYTLSIGGVITQGLDTSPTEAADAKLYQAKDGGRDRVVV